MDSDPFPATEQVANLLLDIINNPLLSVPVMSTAQIVALALAVLALFISGFVSGSEISFFSLTPIQCDELEESSSGERVLRLLRIPERLLATILIINNLVNVTIVVLCNFALGPVFSGLSPVWSFVLQTVLLTFLILLFGEILPKLYANSNNMGWAKMAAPIIEAGVKLFYPLSSVLVKSSGLVKKVVTKKNTSVTADDLSQALEIAQVSDGDNKDMLEGILKFGDTTASEVRTPRVDVTGLDVESDFAEVMKVVIESGFARLP
ncbi:MAG: CNNM domain-containing protein, partial [Duncaniella sp.]|nr:CNNM domain-containing protein [Duncaniella sp.]